MRMTDKQIRMNCRKEDISYFVTRFVEILADTKRQSRNHLLTAIALHIVSFQAFRKCQVQERKQVAELYLSIHIRFKFRYKL